MRKRRWSDNDRHFGPFTFAMNGSWRPMGIVVDSGEDEESPGCHLRLYARWFTLLCELPPIVQPYRERVTATYWDAATIERMGRDWYENTHSREYGFQISDGHLQVYRGRQTGDSSTTQSWSCFLPWTQWRHIRHSLYNDKGAHYWTEGKSETGLKGIRDWMDAEENCPSVSFEFDDYDGERITATTRIEEREWKFGEGYFKWLSLFRKARVHRSLDIDFSQETGAEKGSWKGGTMGHSIEMLPGELHESAFRRYCNEHKMTFIGEVLS
jgi:hypothetical protein